VPGRIETGGRPPEDLLGDVAGDGGKAWLTETDPRARIGDHDSFGGGFEDFGRQASVFLHAPPADRLLNHCGQQVQVDRLGILDDVVVPPSFMASTAVRSLPVPVTMTIGGRGPRSLRRRMTSKPS